jgi:hypothetical protein
VGRDHRPGKINHPATVHGRAQITVNPNAL